MYTTVKTIYNTHLELLKTLKKPFTLIEYSTLNEKFNLYPNAILPEGVYPDLGYIAIGRGGHRGRVTSTASSVIDVLQHNIKHACLYEHVPFVLRPISSDLSPGERMKYGMRVLIEKNAAFYFAYYLKKIDYSSSYPSVQEITITDGASTIVDYVPTPSQLTPTPIPYSNTNVNVSSGKHISVSSKIEVALTKEDIAEIRDAIDIIYGDEAYATISEIATVTAIPLEVDTTLGGVNIRYTEAIAAQIANHIPANIDLRYTVDGIVQVYSLGHTAPYVV